MKTFDIGVTDSLMPDTGGGAIGEGPTANMQRYTVCTSQNFTMAPGENRTFTCREEGYFVFVQAKHFSETYLTLCEVEVFGTSK